MFSYDLGKRRVEENFNLSVKKPQSVFIASYFDPDKNPMALSDSPFMQIEPVLPI